MKEKTFNELIGESPLHELLSEPEKDLVKDLLQQVCEATKAEIENKANEYGEYGTADYVHEMPTDRIRIEP